MQFRIRVDLPSGRQTIERIGCSVVSPSQLVGNEHTPLREMPLDRLEPSRDPGFAIVDFLTSADQTDHDGPISVPIEVGQQELRLGLGKARAILLSSHERRGLPKIPGTLRLIEDHHMLRWRGGLAKASVSEVMHVLNECLHFMHGGFLRATLGRPFSGDAPLCFISRQ